MRRRLRCLDDRELLFAAVDDREAFAELYRRHFPGVLAYFRSVVGRNELALDLAAETFAAILIALPSYRPTDAPGSSWLYAIARNQLASSARRGSAETRARKQLQMQALVLSDAGEAALDRLVAAADIEELRKALRRLPDEQRDAVTARFLEGRDYAEIADQMQCSEQVVRKRVSRGLASLRLSLHRL
jgi:RNA polymerase sigma-70 factor (ECF subfamily)